MSAAPPSDALRDVYERRADLEYPEPLPLPDPALDVKFGRTMEVLATLLPCEALLDAGCGDGRFLAALPRYGPVPPRLYGSDLSERILETARRLTAAHGVRPELVQANLEALPFPGGSFDLVLSSQVIEHLLDPPAGMRELARVLRPGGRLLVTTLNDEMKVTKALDLPRATAVRLLRLRGRRIPVEYPEWPMTQATLRALVEEAGLELEHEETFRFSLISPLNVRPAVRALNALERRVRPHGVGDILLAVARRPA